jgi:pyrroloquinoline quinone biosynthesis protein B
MKLPLMILLTSLASASYAQAPYVVVLGVAQDGGYPQAGCQKECCRAVWADESRRRSVACIAVVDPVSKEKWLFDATPDFTEQLHRLNQTTGNQNPLTGIFLTHAHMGHYTGLMHLGREVMGADRLPVFAMPKMRAFLEGNGPWSQLVYLHNIALQPIEANQPIALNKRISVVPFRVPHRDEFSETVGYQITLGRRSLVYIPDIDKWQQWEQNLADVVQSNDFVLLDGTFYQDGEINRPMREVPHPFVTETMELLAALPISQRQKVHFIHLNHTNPVLQPSSPARQEVQKQGFRVAEQGQQITFE